MRALREFTLLVLPQKKRSLREARWENVASLFSIFAAISSNREISGQRQRRKNRSQLIRPVVGCAGLHPPLKIELSRRDAILRRHRVCRKKSRAESREGRNFVNRVGLPLEGVGASVHYIDRRGGRYPACLYVRVCMNLT